MAVTGCQDKPLSLTGYANANVCQASKFNRVPTLPNPVQVVHTQFTNLR